MCIIPCSNKMMPAQLSNAAKAGLGPLPPVTVFFEAIAKKFSSNTDAPADAALFGDTFSTKVPGPKGTEKNMKNAYNTCKDFEQVLKTPRHM